MLNEIENSLETLCRSCRKSSDETDQMIYLFDKCDPSDSFSQDFPKISDLFSKYVLMEVDESDDISQFICIECYELLKTFHSFRKMCVASYLEFLNEKNPNLKKEEPVLADMDAEQIFIKEEQVQIYDGPFPFNEDFEEEQDELSLGYNEKNSMTGSEIDIKTCESSEAEPSCSQDSHEKNIKSKNGGNSNKSVRKKKCKKKRSSPEFKPAKCNCLKKCPNKFKKAEQKVTYEYFCNLESWSEETEYIFNLIELVPIRKRRPNLKNTQFKKSSSRNYYLTKRDGTKVIVCKSFFMEVLQLSDGRIDYLLSRKARNGILCNEDKRGKKSNRKIPKQNTDNILTFLNTFSGCISTDESSSSSVKRLPLTLQAAYAKYQDYCSENSIQSLSYFMFRQTCVEKQGYKFLRQKEPNQCCTHCNDLNKRIESENDEKLKANLISEKDLHLRLVENLDRDYKETVEFSTENPEHTLVLVYKFGSPIDTPKLSKSDISFKKTLRSYYLYIHEITNNTPFIYFWHEGIASNGPAEIGSCLIHFLKNNLLDECENVIIYSEDSRSDDRSQEIRNMLLNFLAKSVHINTITQKFCICGHLIKKCAPKMQLIQRAVAKATDVYIPDEWSKIIKESKPSNPKFDIIKMESENFLSAQRTIDFIDCPASDNKKEFILCDAIHSITMRNLSEFNIEYEYFKDLETKFDEDADNKIQSPRTMNVASKNSNYREFRKLELDLLYPNGRTISSSKRADLIGLLKDIPEKYHAFYNELK